MLLWSTGDLDWIPLLRELWSALLQASWEVLQIVALYTHAEYVLFALTISTRTMQRSNKCFTQRDQHYCARVYISQKITPPPLGL